MVSRRPPRRVAAALCLAILSAVPALSSAQPAPAPAQPDPYKLHMENGVKLFQDANYSAALAEFQAAYEARPTSGNPLLNIALCHKALFHYPQAIAALETLLRKHIDSMDPGDIKASQDAIKEMRGLLGTVTVTAQPPAVQLSVDGEDLPPDAGQHPLPLGPGAHKIAARAEGYAPSEQSILVASGRELKVTFTLVAEKGQVQIEAPAPRMTIAVDEQPVGVGSWSGMLSPGQHVVQMYGADGQPTVSMQILVSAGGQPLLVKKGVGGIPWQPKRDEPSQRRGLYVLGMGSVLFPTTHPPTFPDPKVDFGAGYGLRAGFQVNRVAGFEASYEHSSITTSRQDKFSDSISNYRILADRFSVGLRLISSGRTVRFVGALGGGIVINGIQFTLNTNSASPTMDSAATLCLKAAQSFEQTNCPLTAGTAKEKGHVLGVDAFALAEAGLEIDLDHVLIDLVAEAEFQSTGNLTNASDQHYSVFQGRALGAVGPGLRVGYRFW